MAHALSRETGTAAAPDQGDGRTDQQFPNHHHDTATNDVAPIVIGPADSLCAVKIEPEPAEWLDVPGWPGYQIHPRPPVRVRSRNRVVVDRNGRALRLRGCERAIVDGGVQLSHCGYRRTLPVSRLVRAALHAAGEAA